MRFASAIVLACVVAGCGTAMQGEWTKPGTPGVVRVAVLPFENQTPSLRAGLVASDLVTAELIATGRMEVMEPSEVLDSLRRENLDPGELSRLPSAQRLGRLLRASHILQGSVTEYRYKPGLSETPVVGVTGRLIDVASGEVVWTASHSRTGYVWFWEDGLSRVTQAVARDMVTHLVRTITAASR